MQTITEMQQLDKMKSPIPSVACSGGGMRKRPFIMLRLCRNAI